MIMAKMTSAYANKVLKKLTEDKEVQFGAGFGDAGQGIGTITL